MNLKYLISAVLILFALGTAKGQDPVIVDEIIAKVDNYIVLKSDLEKRHLDALSNGVAPTEDLKCLILGGMVQEKLMVAKAEIDSVVVGDDEVEFDLNRRIQTILAQYNGSEEMVLQTYGKTIEDIRAELREQIREQLIVQRMQQTLTEGLTVTPSEVRKFFRRIPSDSLPYYDMEVEIGQISKTVLPGDDQKQKVIDQLNDIRREVVGGRMTFENAAIRFSQGPSGPSGGDLGTVVRGAMVPAYEAEALKLKPNEVSGPVESQFGFHLIKMISRRGNEYHSKHILITPQPSENDIDNEKSNLDSLRTLIINDSITFDLAARENSDDDMTKGTGGYFTDQTGGTLVSIRDLDPEIYFAVDSLNKEEITIPSIHQTADGKTAVRIIYYKSSRDPHQANLTDDWGKIQSAALMEKRNKMLTEWFNDAKGDVFILLDDDYTGCKIVN